MTNGYGNPRLTCDIVMKGGITSGVIYPRAVAELARTYRLSQVGGASAGAIAAAAAAAAELGRHTGGFEELDRMPAELAEPGPGGRSTLATFFQPTRTAAPLFHVLFGAAEATGNKTWAIINGLLRHFPAAAILGALPGLVLIALGWLGDGVGAGAAIVGGVLVLLVGVAAAVGWAVLRRFGRVAADGYGMCTGMPGDNAGQGAALTPWLHAKIQSLAGRDPAAPPVTFGDLRRAGVTLRTMTTNLTRHQPMAMPWSTREFFFDPEEFRGLFPAEVVDWMVAHPAPGVTPVAQEHLRPWPAEDDLPVIVATRMSLSFPVLITAVRLWAVDYTEPANQEAPREQRTASSVWFTDGGLCANLPVHFFDTPLPRHPTFAFNLGPFPPGREKSPEQEHNSYLPTSNVGGLQRPWFPLPTAGMGAWRSFGALMIHTAREWVDGAQMVMPGYRDRIVTVHHDESEGGMNLSMPPQVVSGLAERGRLGAEKLVRTFAGPQPGVVPAKGWDNHRWIRFRTAAGGLGRWLVALERNYHDTSSGGTPYSELAGPGATAPLPSYRPSVAEREVINDRAAGMVALADKWKNSDAGASTAPRPAPQLRLVPDDGTASGLDLTEDVAEG
ncbi:patatin-like phospholipase family protein [Tessaracoccus sp. MC1865]|uniref:patatin-like phospholipase family protein n=1 Tax=Tessaracoccus sp. MC1865 TaxID=2760310 RepID=UPI001600CCB1|nr:patatin-like phospholipase family protein [Tessaracoccus sp. MC1865]MBB1483394.1 patatin-like phospholipase family protein [Tessaracoccus sp. MC1865]QTO36503.1 patatin-like phospholipase family protein [Tessaracoccus sp. MC1865]